MVVLIAAQGCGDGRQEALSRDGLLACVSFKRPFNTLNTQHVLQAAATDAYFPVRPVQLLYILIVELPRNPHKIINF